MIYLRNGFSKSEAKGTYSHNKKEKRMKSLLIGTTIILIGAAASAFNVGKYHSGDLPNCPASSEQLLEVTEFLGSANSESQRGICKVKANYYSWWDLISEHQQPSKIEVEVGYCNASDFLRYDEKRLIKGTVSYSAKVSMCESNPGCHFECRPNIVIWSL